MANCVPCKKAGRGPVVAHYGQNGAFPQCYACYWNKPHPLDAQAEDPGEDASPLCAIGSSCGRVAKAGSEFCEIHSSHRAAVRAIVKTDKKEEQVSQVATLKNKKKPIECATPDCKTILRTRKDAEPKAGDVCGKCKIKAGAYEKQPNTNRPEAKTSAPAVGKEQPAQTSTSNGSAKTIRAVSDDTLAVRRYTRQISNEIRDLLAEIDTFPNDCNLDIDCPKAGTVKAFQNRVSRALHYHTRKTTVPYQVPEVKMWTNLNLITVVKKPKAAERATRA